MPLTLSIIYIRAGKAILNGNLFETQVQFLRSLFTSITRHAYFPSDHVPFLFVEGFHCLLQLQILYSVFRAVNLNLLGSEDFINADAFFGPHILNCFE